MELISKEVVRRIIDSGRTREQMLEMVESAVTEDSSTESSTDCYEQGNGEQDERLKRAAKALEQVMPGQEWRRGEINLYKLGERAEKGFRKGLKE